MTAAWVYCSTPASLPVARALQLLAEAGCRVSYDTLTAWIPPAVVERCLALAPREVALASRSGTRTWSTGQARRRKSCGRVMLSSQGQRPSTSTPARSGHLWPVTYAGRFDWPTRWTR